ncbi:glycosyl hydrolase family 28-related protein [Frigidibacter sp.]|uniref:glycosyl hydrolase family 28-related protein n=1 Tax=Frigidibacter sp. TaxID=2586418 RepID=UPI00273484FF|nr:glycosyl hydrolase family 28-related protein [Frigidibacter sp.]MDP3338867.1 glycosyl hydrolase family 28-related protein [Frigidibacter sp.]
MNKAITDGLLLMPPAFEAGLGVWSSENGTAGSATYAGASNAALVPADQDFGNCLELLKTSTTQKLRYMGQTPLLPGCYLRITARVKVISGNLPSVRIAGWAMGAGELHVTGLDETAPEVTLTEYGEVVTVQAIVGSGSRGGVDMPWGTAPIYGHFGLDLTGSNGGVVRIDDIEIEDITAAFLRDMIAVVDVRDFGAKGDGVSNDQPAFAAADAAAAGRTVLVPAGNYYLGSTITINSPIRFEGQVTMPDSARLQLARSFDLPTYIDAFGGDEVLGFKKAFQALLNFTDHDSLDMKGRRVELSAPIDMYAAVGNKETFAVRRVLRNGQFNVVDGPAWAPTVMTSQATYNSANPVVLSAVADIANVPVGARVTGNGVGREVYVTAKNVGAGTLTISHPLYGGSGTQVFTFTRFKYVLDFSGFAQLSRFNIDDVEFLCNGFASGIMLAQTGDTFQLRDCSMARPRDRAITSIGTGCQSLLIDRCQFLSNEMPLRAQDRTSIAVNINANDCKIRDNRVVRFRHFLVAAGNGHILQGNHWFQGDEETAGLRVAGLVLAETNLKVLIVGNYIDNSVIEWTNEYEATPNFVSQYSFGGLTITGNIFTANDVAPWFNWLVIKPYGTGHFVQGLTMTGNVFKTLNGTITRVEGVDTTFAGLDMARMRNVIVENNTFTGVDQVTASPVFLQHDQATEAATWTVAPGAYLPFGGWARNVESVVAEGMITTASGARVSEMPFVQVEQGTSKQEVRVNWSAACKGRMQIKVRVDNPN